VHEGEAWLQCQYCHGSFARDKSILNMRGESMGCPKCGQISIIGAPE
jgi:Zn finger protein HypA/HybF involved in hydrogenase expression